MKITTMLEIDSFYEESQIKELKMKPLDNLGMKYELYALGFYVYFFKRLEDNILQLFCRTSKESYYESCTVNYSRPKEEVGVLEWLLTKRLGVSGLNLFLKLNNAFLLVWNCIIGLNFHDEIFKNGLRKRVVPIHLFWVPLHSH